MGDLRHLLDKNAEWSESVDRLDPDFFTRLSQLQSPEYLWIGCADSRVPANEIVGLQPGELFVHRNVANLVVHTDLNCLSVIQYAVDMLKVRHIIVCGHYGCGGVAGSIDGIDHGLIDNWLRHIEDVAERYDDRLQAISDSTARCDHLCELNVIEQVANVCRTTIVRDAWSRDQNLTVHGWIYGLSDGLIRDLGLNVSGIGQLESSLTNSVDGLDSQ